MSYGGRKKIEDLLLLRFTTKIKRNCDGSCCECGACCDRVLMLTDEEKEGLHKFLKSNPKLKKRVLDMYRQIPHRMCPFLDFTKSEHKCMIYGTKYYPIICKIYNCDQSKMSQMETFILYKGIAPGYVDMWAEFFGEKTDIAFAWSLKDHIENATGKSVHPSIMLTPERLPEVFGLR